MIIYNSEKNISGNTLEIHYWFGDNSHTMNAVIQNRCEFEVLGILKELSNLLSVEVIIETEPISEGGLRRWLKVVRKDENKNATITTAIIVSLVTVLLTTPIAKITEKVIDNILEDTELKELEKEKLRLEIKKLKKETLNGIEAVDYNTVLKKKKSNFYESLEKCSKVEKVSYKITDQTKQVESKDLIIERENFKKFILSTDDLEPIEKENAIIEIISPVLKKGRYKWTGYYNQEAISFTMKSKEFKELVLAGNVEFKNGSTINCLLKIKRKIDNEGAEKIVGYEVLRVNEYLENQKIKLTKEGKKYHSERQAEKMQLDLFASKE